MESGRKTVKLKKKKNPERATQIHCLQYKHKDYEKNLSIRGDLNPSRYENESLNCV